MLSTNEANILRDLAIETERKIKSNSPDFVIKAYKRKTCVLIVMSVPTDNDTSVKEYNEISKYKDLEIETEKNVTP